MKRNAKLSFVVSLHFALFSLISKPVAVGGDTGVTVVLGTVSFVALLVGVVYEVAVQPPESASL